MGARGMCRGRTDAYGLYWGNLKERNHLENLDVNGKIILK
jgi:hypothetical protein